MSCKISHITCLLCAGKARSVPVTVQHGAYITEHRLQVLYLVAWQAPDLFSNEQGQPLASVPAQRKALYSVSAELAQVAVSAKQNRQAIESKEVAAQIAQSAPTPDVT